MNIASQRAASPIAPSHQTPSTSCAASSAPLLEAVSTVSNNEFALAFKPYPEEKSIAAKVWQWLSGGSVKDCENDVELRSVRQVSSSGARRMNDAQQMRDLCEQPQFSKNRAGTFNGKTTFLVGLAAFGAGVGAGTLASWYFTRNNASDNAASASSMLGGIYGVSDDVSFHRPNAAFLQSASGDAAPSLVPESAQHAMNHAKDKSRSLYIRDVLLNNSESPVTESTTQSTTPAATTTTAKPYNDTVGDYYPIWNQVPTNNELQENIYIEQLLEKQNATILTRDLYELKRDYPERYQRIRVVISTLTQLIESAIAGIQSVTNSHLKPRPSADEHSAAVVPVSRIPSGITTYGRPIEVYDNNPSDGVHNQLFNFIDTGKQFTESLLMLMAKSLSSLKRTYPDYGSSFLNFIMVKSSDENKLYATTGNTALMRQGVGFNQPNIIVGEDFFNLCLYDAMQICMQQLTYYYTDTTELFPMLAGLYFCEKVNTPEERKRAEHMISHVEGWKLRKLKDNAATLMKGRWKNIRPALSNQELREIPDFPINGTRAERRDAFIKHYQVSTTFRNDINARNAAYYSNMILAIGNTQNYIDSITFPFWP